MSEEILMKRAILHILDHSGGISILSDKIISMSSEIEEYLSKHLKKCFSDIEVKNTIFLNESTNGFLSILESFAENDDILEASTGIAKRFIDIMIDGNNIPSGDLIIVDFMYNNTRYLGILKFNYKDSYIHYVESDDGVRNTIVKQPSSLPLETQKLDEFILVNLSEFTLKVKEKIYEMNGVKENYITKYILEAQEMISDKEVVDLVEKSARKIIREEYDNDLNKLNTFKKVITNDFATANHIDLDNIANTTFEDEDGKNAFKEEVQKFGIQEKRIKISPNAEKRITKKQKLVTDTGIEINIPSTCLSDSNVVEFVNNVDGTISIIIKNIGIINNK